MRIRSFVLQMVSLLILLGTGGVTFGVLSSENRLRKKRTEEISLLEKIRQSRLKTAFEGKCTIETHLKGTRYTTQVEIHREGAERKIHLLDSRGGEKKHRGHKMRFFGGIPGLFQPGKFRRGRIQDPVKIAKNYHIMMGEDVMVAGCSGKRIRLEPKIKDRPSYEMVADNQTSFPLQFSVFDRPGKIAYEKRFDSIRFLPGSFHGKRHPKRPSRATWVKIDQEKIAFDELSRLKFPVWIPTRLPVGFTRSDSMRIKIEATPPKKFGERMLRQFHMDLEVLHLLYSDGIALFSMVQFSIDNPVWKMMKSFFPKTGDGEGVSTRKLSMGIGSAFILELEGTVVILSGNVWPDSLQKTAESLKIHIGETR